MKRFILLVALCVATQHGFAQKSELSETQKFSERDGSLIEKKFQELGRIDRCTVSVLTIIDLIKKDSLKGVFFEMKGYETYDNTKTAYLDADELDNFIIAMQVMSDKIITRVPTESGNEAIFRSRSGFSAGCYYDKKKKRWQCYVQLDKYQSGSILFLFDDGFSGIILMMQNAKQRLSQ